MATIKVKPIIVGADSEAETRSDIKVKVKISEKLMCLLKRLYSKTHTEFTMYVYGTVKPWPILPSNQTIEIDITDYYVPQQVASTATVEAKEPPPIKAGVLVGTIHKHPPGISTFSYTDHEYTNSKFPFNLLIVREPSYTYSFTYGRIGKILKIKTKTKKARKKDTEEDIKLKAAAIWVLNEETIGKSLVSSVDTKDGYLIINVNDTNTMFVKAKIAVTTDIVVQSLKDESTEDCDKLVEEALGKIEQHYGHSDIYYPYRLYDYDVYPSDLRDYSYDSNYIHISTADVVKTEEEQQNNIENEKKKGDKK